VENRANADCGSCTGRGNGVNTVVRRRLAGSARAVRLFPQRIQASSSPVVRSGRTSACRAARLLSPGAALVQSSRPPVTGSHRVDRLLRCGVADVNPRSGQGDISTSWPSSNGLLRGSVVFQAVGKDPQTLPQPQGSIAA
jgi:hypothetical protein